MNWNKKKQKKKMWNSLPQNIAFLNCFFLSIFKEEISNWYSALAFVIACSTNAKNSFILRCYFFFRFFRVILNTWYFFLHFSLEFIAHHKKCIFMNSWTVHNTYCISFVSSKIQKQNKTKRIEKNSFSKTWCTQPELMTPFNFFYSLDTIYSNSCFIFYSKKKKKCQQRRHETQKEINLFNL